MLKIWNVSLITITFLLTLLGTFITRSGVIESVHSFGVSRVGPFFLWFLLFAAGVSVYLILIRLPDLQSDHALDSLLSRESSFLLNNLLLVGSAFAVLWGTLFPIISEAVTSEKITVGAVFQPGEYSDLSGIAVGHRDLSAARLAQSLRPELPPEFPVAAGGELHLWNRILACRYQTCLYLAVIYYFRLCHLYHWNGILEGGPCRDEVGGAHALAGGGQTDPHESATVWRLYRSPGRGYDCRRFHRADGL